MKEKQKNENLEYGRELPVTALKTILTSVILNSFKVFQTRTSWKNKTSWKRHLPTLQLILSNNFTNFLFFLIRFPLFQLKQHCHLTLGFVEETHLLFDDYRACFEEAGFFVFLFVCLFRSFKNHISPLELLTNLIFA